MSKKNQRKKKKQTAVNVEMNKSKSNKSLESFIKASLGALLSFGITGLACTANLSFNFGDNISETSSEKSSENASEGCQKKYFIKTKTKNGYVIVCSDDRVNIHSDGSVSFLRRVDCSSLFLWL